MPHSGESGQGWDTGQGGGPAQVPGQAEMPAEGVPGQAGPAVPSQPSTSDHQGQQEFGYPSEGVTAPMQRRPISPVNEIETRVTGRRVVQYIIDYVVTAAVASFIIWVLDRGTGAANIVLLLIGALLSAAWYFWYWVYRPQKANGQTFGMQLLRLRIISLDGGPASMLQLFIRGILLIVDTLFWGLVGLITMVCSRYRQRVGDHAAKTLVVRARMQAMPAPREHAGAGRAGYR